MPDENDPFKNPEGNVNYLEALVGEGKKFKTVDDLAKGKAESDSYIETLKQENESLKLKAAEGKSVAELLEALKQDKNPIMDNPLDKGTQTPPALKEEDIAKIALETLNKSETERRIKSNYDASVAKMREVWGNDANKKLVEVASALSVSIDDLVEVARKSPNAFYQMTGLNADRSVPGGTVAPKGTVNLGTNTKKRDAAYYRDLKVQNPSLWKDTKTQIQMHRDAQSIGEDFFN